MNPASKNPINTRQTTNPVKLPVMPWQIVMIPHPNIIPLSHHEGFTFFRIILLGTSNRIYGIKKTNSAILYWCPLIPRSFSRPINRAFPILMRSRKANMKRRVRIGTTWRSHLRRRRFSASRSDTMSWVSEVGLMSSIVHSSGFSESKDMVWDDFCCSLEGGESVCTCGLHRKTAGCHFIQSELVPTGSALPAKP